MKPDFSMLDSHLQERGVDGYLVYADSGESDQYYLSGFDAPDPFVTLYDGATHLLFLRGLEYGRAKEQARAETVSRGSDYDLAEKVDEYGNTGATDRVLVEFLQDHDVTRVGAPGSFPLRVADALRDLGVEVMPDDGGIITEIRATKTDEEIDHIRTAQRANERAMARAEELLQGAHTEEGQLVYDDEVLTSERIKREIEITLLRHGCALDETIVACGRDAADPHNRGGGPLEAGEPIIIDIFPRDKTTNYHADMTRTFCKGEPSETLGEWYTLADRARRAALQAVEPGATGEAVHDAVCDVYEAAGLPTLRADDTAQTGFIHSTGHGIGLDVHEQPNISTDSGPLEPGHVVTIEPGLYDPDIGGVRIEDLVVVTDDGYENLTDYDVSLVVD